MNKIICNMCGKEFNEFDSQENFGFHYIVGYGSKHDGEQIDLDICCDCFDKMIAEYILPQCKINPISDSSLGWIANKIK